MAWRKVGRFEAYIPDRSTFDILLSILSHFKKDDQIEATPVDLHRFFYEKKAEWPEIFKDVSFTKRKKAPYSPEISDAFLSLQESSFLTRPNPSLKKYRINFDLEEEKEGIDSDEKEIYATIAEQFGGKFIVGG